jgi:hypothetical protein|tara:strand:- start:1054 stop:1635 length:582 start_codon:yes stop_codon:yes gene_type:complete
MQSDAERTLNNLNILAVLSQNDKLLTNDDTFDIHAPTTMRAMYRFWSGEKRSTNIQRVRICVRSAKDYIWRSLEEVNAMGSTSCPPSPESSTNGDFHLITPDSTMHLKLKTTLMQHLRMSDALKRSQKGIHNLLQTYRDDPALTSQVQVIVDEISDFLAVTDQQSVALRRRYGVTSEPEETEHKTLTQTSQNL